MSVRIYVEGGFEGSTKSNCRKGFSALLAKVVEPEHFKVIASGDRAKAYQGFCSALRRHPDDYIILLVDSETEVTAATPWQHLKTRQGDNWEQPDGVESDQAHLMIQMMESWFLADRKTVAAYYGKGFLANSLPRQTDIERIDKAKVLQALESATKRTKKGRYHKTRHGFELLELISPELIEAASPHAHKFFDVLRHKIRERGATAPS